MIKNNKPNLVYILKCIEKSGNPSSIIMLERENCNAFKDNNGIIIFCSTPKYNIVYGDPICDKRKITQIIKSFEHFCSKSKKKAIYINCSESFANFMYKKKYSIIDFADELKLNLEKDYLKQSGFYGNLLRRKYKAGQKFNIDVKEYIEKNVYLEKKLDQTAKDWLKNRTGYQAGVIPLNVFKNRINKRWFYATHNNKIVGLLTINEYQENKYVINMLMHTPHSPSPTSEYLVLKTLEILKSENIKEFNIGIAPKPKLGDIKGFNYLFKFLIKYGYKFATKIMNLAHRQRFWKKFGPIYHKSFLIFPNKYISYSQIKALLKSVETK